MEAKEGEEEGARRRRRSRPLGQTGMDFMHDHQPHLRESAKAGSAQRHVRKGRMLAFLLLLPLLLMLLLFVALVSVLLLAVVVVVVVVVAGVMRAVVQGSAHASPRNALYPARASSRNALRPARASPRTRSNQARFTLARVSSSMSCGRGNSAISDAWRRRAVC